MRWRSSFIDSNYNVKAVMREIANSDTYQLSSTYPGQWNEAWEPYFARKFVRRLWGEEIVDGVVQATGSIPCATVVSGACTVQGYTVNGWTDLNGDRPTLHDAVSRCGEYGGHDQRLPGQLPARKSRRPAAAQRRLDSAGAEPDERDA